MKKLHSLRLEWKQEMKCKDSRTTALIFAVALFFFVIYLFLTWLTVKNFLSAQSWHYSDGMLQLQGIRVKESFRCAEFGALSYLSVKMIPGQVKHRARSFVARLYKPAKLFIFHH